MLPPSFFEQLSDRLELAVYDTNAEYRMTLADLKAEIGDVQGVDTLSVRYGDGLQFVTFNGRTTALPEAASIDEIRRALNLQKIDSFIAPVAFADMAQTAEIPNMVTTGASFLANLIRTRQAQVKEQLSKAGNELNAVMDEMEATADAATKQVADAKAEVADLKAALGLNSNGEPA